MSKVYLVVCEDRHCDDEITAHATLELANKQFEIVKAHYDDAEWIERKSGWVRYADQSDDGPYLHIEEIELELGDGKLIAVFVEGRFAQFAEAATREESVAFCQGYCAAAGRFSANTALYVLPEDAEELRREEHPDEVRRAIDAIGGRT